MIDGLSFDRFLHGCCSKDVEQYVNLESLAIANAQVMEQPPPRTIIVWLKTQLLGRAGNDESAITDAVKRNSEWAVLLRATPDITQATIDDILQLIAAGGQSKVIFAVFEVQQ